MTSKTVWPSGLRRWLQVEVRKGVGSNPTAVKPWCGLSNRLSQVESDVLVVGSEEIFPAE